MMPRFPIPRAPLGCAAAIARLQVAAGRLTPLAEALGGSSSALVWLAGGVVSRVAPTLGLVAVRARGVARRLLGLSLAAVLIVSMAGCGIPDAPQGDRAAQSGPDACPAMPAPPPASGYPFVTPAAFPSRVIGLLVAVAPGQPGFVASVPLVVAARSLSQAVMPGSGPVTIIGRVAFHHDGGLGGSFVYGTVPATLAAPEVPSINVFLPAERKRAIWLDYCYRVQEAQASMARAHTVADRLALTIMHARIVWQSGLPDLGSGVAGLAALMAVPGARTYLLMSGNLVSSHGADLPPSTRLPAGTSVVLLRYVADGDLEAIQARSEAWTAALRSAGAGAVRWADIGQWRLLSDLFA